MHDVWQDNKEEVRKLNGLWQASEEARRQFEERRNEAANQMERILEAMVAEARKIYGDAPIRTEAVIDNGSMVGLKVWVNDACQIFKV